MLTLVHCIELVVAAGPYIFIVASGNLEIFFESLHSHYRCYYRSFAGKGAFLSDRCQFHDRRYKEPHLHESCPPGAVWMPKGAAFAVWMP